MTLLLLPCVCIRGSLIAPWVVLSSVLSGPIFGSLYRPLASSALRIIVLQSRISVSASIMRLTVPLLQNYAGLYVKLPRTIPPF